MVKGKMYNEIQSYKQMGYSLRRCARTVDVDRKTVRKYWYMTPEAYLRSLAESKKRAKILDPYYDEIVTELETYHNITSAIIYDHLRERHENFGPSYRSVRLYVTVLREDLGIPTEVKIRQYTEVAEQPAGFQAQVDMGQKVMTDAFGKKVKIFIFAMVMSLSRKKFACFQDHPFNAREFVEAHDLAFKYYGGRTEEIVYDQDRVMAVSENAGDLILTEVFESYRKYAGFSIRLCRGFDPESKGKIESVVKYVKGNFLACRVYNGVSSLNSDGLAWLDRTANGRVHETTKMIPDVVFAEEVKHLKPAPTLSKPSAPKTAIIRKSNVVHYRQNRYEVPKGTYLPGREARIVLDEQGVTVSFYDSKTGELLVSHPVESGIGRLVRLPRNTSRYRDTDPSTLRNKLLTSLAGFDAAQRYMDLLIQKYPRYTRDQLRILYQCVTQYTVAEMKKALDYCAERDLISANDLRDTLAFFRLDEPKITPKQVALPEKYQVVQPKVRALRSYAAPVKKRGDA
ncbi:MAG: IS21 family transposase [Treponema sp.]|nr:IS21 family transposase [Treponema sp.]